jgi:hypothetical protein
MKSCPSLLDVFEKAADWVHIRKDAKPISR